MKKEVCKQCILGMGKMWDKTEDMGWEEAWIKCPRAFFGRLRWRISYGCPPSCNYKLEHEILEQQVVNE